VTFPRPDAEFNIVFVCSGNTCRSPLAVAAWRAFASRILASPAPLAAATLPTSTVASAGLNAVDGEPASPATIEIARDWGIDLSDHRARRLTPETARAADLICTMTMSQAEAVRAYFDLRPDSVHPLGALAPVDDSSLQGRLSYLWGNHPPENFKSPGATAETDILDPYGGSIEAYQTCAEQIRRGVLGLARALRAGEK